MFECLLQTRQRQSVDKLLVEGAEGFTFTGDQDRYDACEEAVNGVLQSIKRVAQSWKVNLLFLGIDRMFHQCF